MTNCRAGHAGLVGLAGFAGLALLTLGSALTERPAHACHPPQCSDQIVLPGAGRSIPANAKAILVYPKVMWGSPPAQLEVLLVRQTQAGNVAVTTTVTARLDGGFEIQPDAGFEPNASYLLTVPDHCEGSGKLDSTALQHSFSTTASAPLPQTLGTTQLTSQDLGSLTVATVSGSCDTDTTSDSADVSVALAAAAKPWADLLVYSALVDGQAFSFSSSLAWDLGPFIASGTTVYTVCSSDDPGVVSGVEQGLHKVTFRASLPGTSLTLESAPLSLSLSCPVPTDDMPLFDGGLPPVGGDMGAPPPGGGATPGPAERSGCDVGGQQASGLSFALLALLLLLRRRG